MKSTMLVIVLLAIFSTAAHAGWKRYSLPMNDQIGCRGLNGYDITADGSKIALITCKSGDLNIFDIQKKKLIRNISVQGLKVEIAEDHKVAVRIAPDGKTAYAVLDENSESYPMFHKLVRYDLVGGTAEVVARYEGQRASNASNYNSRVGIRERIQFSPNGKLLLISVTAPGPDYARDLLYSFDPTTKAFVTLISGDDEKLYPIRKIDSKRMQVGPHIVSFETGSMKRVGELPHDVQLGWANSGQYLSSSSRNENSTFILGNNLYLNAGSYDDTYYICPQDGVDQHSAFIPRTCVLRFPIADDGKDVVVTGGVDMLTLQQSKNHDPLYISQDAPYAVILQPPQSNSGDEEITISLYRIDNFKKALLLDSIPTGGYVNFGFGSQLRTINGKQIFVVEGNFDGPSVFVLDGPAK